MSNKFELQQEIDRILAEIQQPGQEQEPSAQEPGTEQAIHVDAYPLPGGETLLRFPNGDAVMLPGTQEDESNIIESVPQTEEVEEPVTEEATPLDNEQEEYAGPRLARYPTRPIRRKKKSIASMLVSIAVITLFASAVFGYFVVAPMVATATVTITPQTKSMNSDAAFTVTQHPKAGEVQGSDLAPVSFTKSVTVPATGYAHDAPTNATGVITFYNADQQSYTIPAGTSFNVQSVTVVTDSTVAVQASVPPSFGTGITLAHVVQVGIVGNLPAHTIYTRCCGSPFVTATNTSAFSGGQDARSYSFIQTSDVKNAATDLLSSLTLQATAALNKEVRPGEQVVTPLCSPRTTESAEPGAQAITVTVSVTQTCTAVTYVQNSLQQVATNALARNINPNYEQVGTVQVTVNGSSNTSNTANLKVTLTGTWVYHFSSPQLIHLKNLLAGKTQEQAKAIMKKVEGVVNVTIRLQRFDLSDQLPTNPQHIAIQFFYIIS